MTIFTKIWKVFFVLSLVLGIFNHVEFTLAANKFVAGDHIQTTTTLNVRATPSFSSLRPKTQPSGALGIIVGGPIIANGYSWWNIDYDIAPDGWSAENFLVKVSSPLPIPPAPNPKVSSICGNVSSCTITFPTAGAYSVKLIATDGTGRTATAYQSVIVGGSGTGGFPPQPPPVTNSNCYNVYLGIHDTPGAPVLPAPTPLDERLLCSNNFWYACGTPWPPSGRSADAPWGSNATDGQHNGSWYCNLPSALWSHTPPPPPPSNPVCGNGILETGEQCDGTNLNSQTCTTKGFSGGTLSCASSCTFNTSACTTPPLVLPDLIADDPWIPPGIISGQAIQFNDSVTNASAVNAGASDVSFKVNGVGVSGSPFAVPGLAPWTSSSQIFANWTAGPAGDYTLQVCADDNGVVNGEVAESNENNNCFSKPFTVSPPPTVAPTCSASPSSVKTRQSTTLSASDGNGSYAWSIPGGTPSSGAGTSIVAYYKTKGTKTVTVTSNSQSGVCYVTVGTIKFITGDRVQTTATVNVRVTPSTNGAIPGSQSLGALGTVIGGPVVADGYNWRNVNYDSSPDGWSAEDFLAKATTSPPPPPPPPPTPESTSASTVIGMSTLLSGLRGLYSPTVLALNGVKKMWLGGWLTNADVGPDKLYISNYQNVDWSSPRLINWTNVGYSSGVKPGYHVNDPSVIRPPSSGGIDRSQWLYMYYTGLKDNVASGPSSQWSKNHEIGLASSVDGGETWTDLGIIILPTSSGDGQGAWSPSVVVVGSEIWLYYHTGTSDFTKPINFRQRLNANGWQTLASAERLSFPENISFNAGVTVTLLSNLDVSLWNGSYVMLANTTDLLNVVRFSSSDGLTWRKAESSPEIIQGGANQILTPHFESIASNRYRVYFGYGAPVDSTSIQAWDFSIGDVPPPPPTTATVYYRATLNGASWSGDIHFTSKDNTTWDGTLTFPADIPNAPSGIDWTESYVSGGPSGATFKDITPSATQSITTGDITFTFNFTSTADTIKPTVSITAPADGSTVSGKITISAEATDNVGVTKVEFWADGTLKSTDTSFPYAWETTAVTIGPHTLIAKAYDSAGNVGQSSTITIYIASSASFATVHYRATLNGAPWSGVIRFNSHGTNSATDWNDNLTFPGDVPNAPAGITWTETYVSGGPAGATFQNITPSATQSITTGDITFTFNFTGGQTSFTSLTSGLASVLTSLINALEQMKQLLKVY